MAPHEEPDPKLLNLESALAETRRLREENARLQRLLQEHGIQIPRFPFTDGIPVATSAPSGARTRVLRAEQRIALFRNLFHGRDDVYAVRWENADGRSGSEPRLSGVPPVEGAVVEGAQLPLRAHL